MIVMFRAVYFARPCVNHGKRNAGNMILKEPTRIVLMSFDRHRTNDNFLNPFAVSSACAEHVEASNHTQFSFVVL